jgi:serine acetyltransferase
MIGAGAVVVKDIDMEGTYVGVPVEKIKRNSRAKKDNVI